jgi:hypothetical protein
MDVAEKFAQVEVKRRTVEEDNRFELMEKGEQRNFEKPDKPLGEDKHPANDLASLPPEDLKNVAILALLCMSLNVAW